MDENIKTVIQITIMVIVLFNPVRIRFLRIICIFQKNGFIIVIISIIVINTFKNETQFIEAIRSTDKKFYPFAECQSTLNFQKQKYIITSFQTLLDCIKFQLRKICQFSVIAYCVCCLASWGKETVNSQRQTTGAQKKTNLFGTNKNLTSDQS